MRKLQVGDLFKLSEMLERAEIEFVAANNIELGNKIIKSLHKCGPEMIALFEDVMEIKNFESMPLEEAAPLLKKFQLENGKVLTDFFTQLMAKE